MRIGILGPLEVTEGTRVLSLPGRRLRAVLAVLSASPNQVVSMDRLVDVLWPERSVHDARNAVQTQVSRLRRTLEAGRSSGNGGARVVTIGAGYRLVVATSELDALEFEALAERAEAAARREDLSEAVAQATAALACWRGEAFGELAGEPFAAPRAAELEERRLAIVELDVAARLSLGQHASAVGELERLVTLHPFREQLWADLMVALYRSGRQSDALRAYERLRRMLADELGLQPSPDLAELEAAILGHDPALQRDRGGGSPSVARAVVGPVSPGGRPGRQSGSPQPPLPLSAALAANGELVGRSAEQGRLEAAWREAAAGAGQLVLIAGEAGVGKTRLVADLAARAHADGAAVLWGRCDEDVSAPFQPFAQALRQWVSNAPEQVVRSTARDPHLHRLLPDATTTLTHLPEPPPGDPESQRFQLLEAVASLVTSLSQQRPVLLVVDHLQWAAPPTLLMLRHLARAVPGSAVLVVATYRDTELAAVPPLTATLADLRRDVPTVRLELAGLDPSGVRAYLSTMASALGPPDPALADRVHAETRGNPFFAGQLYLHLAETGALREQDGRWTTNRALEDAGVPASVLEVVARRLHQLEDETRRAVAVAAIVGQEFDLRTLRAVEGAAADPDRLLDALDAAVGAQLVVELPGGRYAFTHALVRRAIVASTTMTMRARLHHRVGQVLAARPGSDPAVVAHHLLAGAVVGEASTAIQWAERAAQAAQDRLAFEEQVALAERALSVADQTDPLDVAARGRLHHLVAAGQLALRETAPAREAALRAADDARAAGDVETFARAALALGSRAQAGVVDATTARLLQEALELIGDQHPDLRALLLAMLAFHWSVNERQGPSADDLAVEAVELARTTGDALTLHQVLTTRALVLVGSPDLDRHEEVIAEIESLCDPQSPTRAYYGGLYASRQRVILHLQRGDVAASRAAAADMERLHRERSSRPLPFTVMWQGMYALMAGQLAEAEQAVAELRSLADANFGASRALQQLVLRLEQGRARELVPRLEARVAERPDSGPARISLAQALVGAGEVSGARAELQRVAADDLGTVPRDSTWSGSLARMAEVCSAAVGDADVAEQLHRELEPYAGQLVVVSWGVVCLGAADRHLGMLDANAGRFDEASLRFAAALQLEERAGAALPAAWTRVRWAHALRTSGGAGGLRQAEALVADARRAARSLQLPALSAAAEGAASPSQQPDPSGADESSGEGRP